MYIYFGGSPDFKMLIAEDSQKKSESVFIYLYIL